MIGWCSAASVRSVRSRIRNIINITLLEIPEGMWNLSVIILTNNGNIYKGRPLFLDYTYFGRNCPIWKVPPYVHFFTNLQVICTKKFCTSEFLKVTYIYSILSPTVSEFS